MSAVVYSVVIRTMGKAGEKYQRLLDSIAKLDPQPREVIVVLPEGYSLPQERLGWETFCFSEKGMVPQRMKGIDQCTTSYALCCDDDVTFDADFVKKLYEPVKQGLGDFSAGPLYSFLPPKGMNALFCMITAAASPTFLHKRDRYVSVLRSSGYSYNRNLKNNKIYETQSLPGTCFFADTARMRDVGFDRETWLEKNGYAAMEDQTLFYKAWLQGKKPIVVPDAVYEHLDAKTSTAYRNSGIYRAMTCNRFVFWHRFIYCTQKCKLLSVLCYGYRLLWDLVYNFANVIRGKVSMDNYKAMISGWFDGWRFIHSKAYRDLDPIHAKP
ncbi:MAG: glycosyltransferase [Candidatus Ventricola sp.]